MAADEALLRMLTLQHRALASDVPVADASGPCAAARLSEWAGQFAASSAVSAAGSSEAGDVVARRYRTAARMLNDGDWSRARGAVYDVCIGVQSIAETSVSGLGFGGSRAAPSVRAARMLQRWAHDCSVVAGYVPERAPTREDHKRILMLYHELGGTLLVGTLGGLLPESLVGVDALGELAADLEAFGEVNRKTALSAAVHLASTTAAQQMDAVALLQRHGLCGEDEATLASEDAWDATSVRLCATLMLRAGDSAGALALLKQSVAAAHSMHAFMGAFELGSRLPPPPGAATTSAGQLRFSLEQMLEVLEAALLQPRHGLASEGQLLRWQLRRMLDFGQPRDAQAAPPLACPPPSPSAPLDEPRVRVVVPFVASERARLTSLLRRWAGSSAPCTLPRRVGAPGVAPGAADLTFLFADPPGAGQEWLHPPEALVGEAARCFGRVELRHANLSRAAQHYVGGWDNTGPNSLFFGLWNDDAVQSAGHDFLFWMETDVVPVAGRWVERILEEARSPRGFWRKGPAQQPALTHSMVRAVPGTKPRRPVAFELSAVRALRSASTITT